MPFLASLDHLVLTVADVQKRSTFTAAFWAVKKLPLATTARPFALVTKNQSAHQGKRSCAARTLSDARQRRSMFLSTVPVAALAGHFKAHGIAVELGPVERTGATGNLLSIYVRDPDGNLIEIANRKRPIF